MAEGVATWSKKGDGLDKVLQDGTHCVETTEPALEATPKSVGNRKRVGTTNRRLKVALGVATDVIRDRSC